MSREVNRGLRIMIYMIPFWLAIAGFQILGGVGVLFTGNWFLLVAVLVGGLLITAYGLGWSARKTGRA